MNFFIAFILFGISSVFAIVPIEAQNPNIFDNPDHAPGRTVNGIWPTGPWQSGQTGLHPTAPRQTPGVVYPSGHVNPHIPTAVSGVADPTIRINKPATDLPVWDHGHTEHPHPEQTSTSPDKILPPGTPTTHSAVSPSPPAVSPTGTITTNPLAQSPPLVLKPTTTTAVTTTIPHPMVSKEHEPSDADLTTVLKTVTSVVTSYSTSQIKKHSTRTQTKFLTEVRTSVILTFVEERQTPSLSPSPKTTVLAVTPGQHDHPAQTPSFQHPSLSWSNCTTTFSQKPAFFECVSTAYQKTTTATVDCKGCKATEVASVTWQDKHVSQPAHASPFIKVLETDKQQRCNMSHIKTLTLPTSTCTVCKAGTDKTVGPPFPTGTGVPNGNVKPHDTEHPPAVRTMRR